MKKLTLQQENNQLSGILGAKITNNILKNAIYQSANGKFGNLEYEQVSDTKPQLKIVKK